MENSKLLSFIRRHLIAILVVLAFLGGGFKFLFDEKTGLEKSKTEFEKYKIEFEKYKLEQENLLRGKDIELEKIKLSIENQQKTVEAQKTSLSQKDAQNEIERLKLMENAGKVSEEASRLNTEAQKLSERARVQKEDDYIKTLMTKFNDLGIDLNSDTRCKSEEYIEKYNRAKSLLAEISSRAERLGKSDEYRSFILSNSKMTTSFTYGQKVRGC